jgi:hypothetical protein
MLRRSLSCLLLAVLCAAMASPFSIQSCSGCVDTPDARTSFMNADLQSMTVQGGDGQILVFAGSTKFYLDRDTLVREPFNINDIRANP